jgi:hypothetical protein
MPHKTLLGLVWLVGKIAFITANVLVLVYACEWLVAWCDLTP